MAKNMVIRGHQESTVELVALLGQAERSFSRRARLFSVENQIKYCSHYQQPPVLRPPVPKSL